MIVRPEADADPLCGAFCERIDTDPVPLTFFAMSAAQVIEAIKELPVEERLDVLRFAREYETVPKLTPEELGDLGERLANATDPEEVAALEKAFMNGFYGMKIEA